MAIWMRSLLAANLLLATTSAIPAVVFPFNSQVPAAARVNQPYLFQISASTFAPGDVDFVYTLSGQPAWLSIDSGPRTLTGTPGQSDTGSSTFVLTAADSTGAAHMQCTLVVATDPLPTLQGDLGEQLAENANLSSSNPAIVTLLPNSAFNFQFRQDSFIDIVQRNLYYYATLADHTPLPSWLHFDSGSLAFSGVAPQLSAFPQSFPIMLIASDVPGFSGTSASFTIRIGERQLVFVPEERSVRFTPGDAVEIGDLGNSLYLNGEKVDITKLKGAEAKDLPGWLTFDERTLSLKGDVPGHAKAANLTITVTEENGDTAMLNVRLDPDSNQTTLFIGTIGTLEATPGEPFEYTIPTSVLGDPDATLTLILPTDATWLQFDSGKRELKGDVPTQTSSSIAATLSARAPSVPGPETQVFNIEIKAVSPQSRTATTLATSRATPTESSTSAAVLAENTESDGRLPGRTIAGIVVGTLLAVAILLALLLLCCRKRRNKQGYEKHGSPSKQDISRPIVPPEANMMVPPVTANSQRDVEKADPFEDTRTEHSEQPPQIALNLPPQSARNSRCTGRFSRASLASSLGNGEDMIRADANIPEWGHDSDALQTPHDSFSVPAQMARVSRQLSDLSPSKRALRRLRMRKAAHQSADSIGLGIGMGSASLHPRRAESRRKARSLGLDTVMDRSDCGSVMTRNTSILSTRPSDFPQPPMGVSNGGFTSHGHDKEKRKSVRLVARSDSTKDDRTLEEKRQSFIKKRRSKTLSSPLWSATISQHRGNGQGSSTEVDVVSGPNSNRSARGKSQLTSYSESSSIQPTRSSHRLSTSRLSSNRSSTTRLSVGQRIRWKLAPGFPRAVTCSTLADEDTEHRPAHGVSRVVATDADSNSENWVDINSSKSTSTESASSKGLVVTGSPNRHKHGHSAVQSPDLTREMSQVHQKELIRQRELALQRIHDLEMELAREKEMAHEMDLAHEMTLPRENRGWVLPNEASPTPPPTLSTARYPSSNRASSSAFSMRNQKFGSTASSRSVSPLAAQIFDNSSLSASGRALRVRRSRLSEPMALTNADSLSNMSGKRAMDERPRLTQTKSGRPVSVEEVQRLSSLRAERVVEEDVVSGADERHRVLTDGSGKAFI